MSSSNNTNANENDSDIDPCEALQQYVTLLLNQSPRGRMMISSLRFQIKETFDKSIKKLTGLKTKEFFKKMKERELIDIESVSEKHGSFDVVVLRKTEKNEETETRSPSSSEDESEDDSDCDDESDSTTSTQSTNDTAIKSVALNDNSKIAESTELKQSEIRKFNTKTDENDHTDDAVENHEGDRTEHLSNRHKGIVQLFVVKKRYGFIKWSGGEELYFQAAHSRKENERVIFYEGDAVIFQIGKDRGKDAAINVVLDPDHRAPKVQGTCITWNEEKGFGFIKREDGEVDVFFHRFSISNGDAIHIGDRVEFECVKCPKNGRLKAVRARKIENESESTIDGPDTTKAVNNRFTESSNLNHSKKRKISDSIDPPSKRQRLDAKDEDSDTSRNVGREQQDQTKERHKGIVQFFIQTKGFGFIKWNGGKDLHFHSVNSQKENERVRFYGGDAVEFEIGTGNKGINDKVAVNVILDPDHTISRIRGKCASWNKQKGFGFIKRDDDRSDIFVHLDHILDHKELQPNERVEFEVVTNPKNGKSRAVRVSRRNKAADTQSEDQMSETSDSDTDPQIEANSENVDSEDSKQSKKRKLNTKDEESDTSENVGRERQDQIKERHKGIVKLFLNQKKYGFIKWDEGEDLLFHQYDIKKVDGSQPLICSGDYVEFEIGVGSNGRNRAIDVILDPDRTIPRIRGKCIEWNEQKGFGFIKRDDDGSDIFVSLNYIMDRGELQPNDRVEFECVKCPENGRLKAVRAWKVENESESTIYGPDATKAVNDAFAESSNLNQSKKRKISDSMDPPSKREKLCAKDEEGDTVGSVGREQQNQTKERHKGIVKLFLNQKKYGFIKWNGEDLLFHQDGIKKVDGSQPSICSGDSVEFEIGVGSKGRNRAIDVILDPDHTISRIRGKCVRWRGDKGFGFIKRDDDSSDIFVSLNYIMDHKELQPNERVEFEVVANPTNGKLRAVRVSRIKESADANKEICESNEGPKMKQAISSSALDVPLIKMSGKGRPCEQILY